ncbi:Arc family DNA-binding protein [Xanthobacter sp. TB0139]|uniref:Arc family DNA-binding protein n=1 Tax=Xanthobacter sp. TB0139 TaxID=3459178 RepID=UPI00403A0035
MAREDPQVNIRMPALLKARLEARARENNRSLTAEIVHLLDQAVSTAPRQNYTKEEFLKDIKNLEAHLRALTDEMKSSEIENGE